MKKGDKIYLALFGELYYCTIVGFRSYCTELETDDLRITAAKCHRGLFYYFGYDCGEMQLFLKKRWHHIPAVICEKIRVRLPFKLAELLKMER